MPEKSRCGWCLKDDLYKDYHDNEWGKAEHDDAKLFEMLLLEGAQAGLSWYTILKKREAYRKAFDGFDPELIAVYGDDKREELARDKGIVRNKLKINAFIENAKAYLKVKKEFGTFDKFIWQFTDHKQIVNHPKDLSEVPAITPEAEAMSKELKKRGFKFVGPTICYAFMQAVGMVDDHVETCYLKKK
ncbi:DNA-3-methyladenine glycosylase I (plasmid) [Fulvitalea axinellae]|uniref:DNA-3-methyladenine glycosylase I n=1 Tax=Fulvitalea axinellae TaxID=1182444 RepID=A0AAU9D1R7_9BACT|nr:DNA-3-methyladenine glycosylase I [Fulvitalea axinellae]